MVFSLPMATLIGKLSKPMTGIAILPHSELKRGVTHKLRTLLGRVLAGFLVLSLPDGSVLAQVVPQQPLAVAQPKGRQVLRGHLPSITARLQPVDRLAPSNRLDVIVGLPLRNQQEAGQLFQQIYDPASPNFHLYLTPAQFAQRFGPAEKDYQALIDFATAAGLTVTGTHPNRTLLDVSGTVAQMEKVLHVSFLVYQHPTEAWTIISCRTPIFTRRNPIRKARLRKAAPARTDATWGTTTGPPTRPG